MYAVQSCNILAQDAPHHILSQEIPSYTGKQKQESADKVTPNRPEKSRFGQHIFLQTVKFIDLIIHHVEC